jgi:hypothetical protein
VLLELNENELKIIAAGLQELPFKLSNPVLKNIQAQYDEANKPEPNEETKATVKKR